MNTASAQPAPLTERPGGLINRQFLLVAAATFVFFTYTGTMIPLIPSLVEHHFGGSRLDIGVTAACFSGSAILARPLLSRLGEHYGMRRLMIGGGVLATTATVASAFVGHRYLLLPFRAMQGIGEAFLFVGGSSLIARAVPPRRRAEAASYYSVAIFVGIGIGPLLTDGLVRNGRYRAAFAVAGGLAALSAVAAAAGPDDPPAVRSRAAQVGRARRGPVFHPDALLPGVTLGIGIAAWVPFNLFIVLHSAEVGFSSSAVIFVVYSVSCLLIRISFARLPERLGLARTTSLAMSGVGAAMAVFASWPTRAGVLVGTLVLSFGVSLLYPALAAMATRRVPEDETVRLMSSFTMFFELGGVVGGLTFGLIADLTSRRGAFAGAAVLAVFGLGFVRLVAAPRLARRTAPSGVASAVAGPDGCGQ